MKARTIIFVAVVSGLFLAGCTKYHSEAIVAKIGDQPITLSEYESMYARLGGGWESGKEASLEERKEFLELIINYKLKIRDAYDLEIHTKDFVKEELEEYGQSLATAFLIEREFIEPALREMHKRRTEELRASHILLRVAPTAAPEDTLTAYNKAMDIIQLLKEGASFELLALEHSDDPNVDQTKGDLYYFTGGMMVRPFEDAVYKLAPGEFTETPIRTSFGYHIVKVTERKPNPGRVRASHILKFARPDASPEDTLKAYTEIHQLFDSLKAGADFAQLAREFSEDIQSAERDGDLGVFQRRRMVQEFDEVAFSLKPGEISDVVRTQFGYHIIKVTERIPPPPFEQIQDDLRREFQQRYMDSDFKKYIANLKDKHGFQSNGENIDLFIASVDSTAISDQTEWVDSLNSSATQLVLASFPEREITAERVVHHIQSNPEFKGKRLTRRNVRDMVNRIMEIEVLQEEARGITYRYPDFVQKIEEYKDGILLYHIEQERVWNVIDISDDVLEAYYEETKENYQIPDRVNIVEIVVRHNHEAWDLYHQIKEGADIEELAAQHTMRPTMRQKRGITGLVDAGRDLLTKTAFGQDIGEVSEPFRFQNNYAIVKTLEREPGRIMTFEEARPQVTRILQDQMVKEREQEWLDSLREQYSVELNYELLEFAFANETQR